MKLSEQMMRYKGTICPKVQLIVEKNKKDIVGWTPNWSSGDQYSLLWFLCIWIKKSKPTLRNRDQLVSTIVGIYQTILC